MGAAAKDRASAGARHLFGATQRASHRRLVNGPGKEESDEESGEESSEGSGEEGQEGQEGEEGEEGEEYQRRGAAPAKLALHEAVECTRSLEEARHALKADVKPINVAAAFDEC